MNDGDAMLLLDLRWLLFGFLLIVVAVASGAVWLDRRRRRKRGAAFLDPQGLGGVLERTPFGWLLLDGPHTYRYANPYARCLLGLDSPAGALPEAPWISLLNEDRAAAQEAIALGCRRSVSLPSGSAVWWWVTSWNDLDVAFLLDITAQRRAEQAVGYLFSGLSHELRTPLGTILTHLEILLLPDISEVLRQQSIRLLKT